MNKRRDELLQELGALYAQLSPEQREMYWMAFFERWPHLKESVCNMLIQGAIAQQKAATVALRKATIAAKQAAAQV
jgi:hypothetical protein